MSIEKPSKSGRVENFDKARAMGDFENAYRNKYVEGLKKELETETNEGMREKIQRQINMAEERSNQGADKIGKIYDVSIEAADMTEEEILNQCEAAEREEEETSALAKNLRRDYSKNPSENMLQAINDAFVAANEAYLKSFAWKHVLGKKIAESDK